MKMNESFTAKLVRWDEYAEELYGIRRQVFVEEQDVVFERVSDESEADSWHVIVLNAEKICVGAGRLQPSGLMSHIAVMRAWRRKGAGSVLVNCLLGLAESEGLASVNIKANAETLRFFHKLGFVAQKDTSFGGDVNDYFMMLHLDAWRRRVDGELWDGALESIEESIQAAVALVRSVRRQLCVYTPYMQSKLYNDIDFVSQLRRRIVEQPRINCRLLLPPAPQWRRSCAHLAQLTEHLSALELRMLPADESRERSEFMHGFMIADSAAGFMHHTDPRFCTGTCTVRGGAKAKHLQEFFNEFWERSLPDRELRSLGI